jgi:hypothetical protein
MSLFSQLFTNLKQLTGLGGVKLKVELDSSSPPQISEKPRTYSGTLHLSSDTDVQFKQLIYRLEMTTVWKDAKGQRREKQHLLGEKVIDVSTESLTAGETKDIPFKIDGKHFELHKTSEQALSEQGGMLGVLGKVGSLVQKQHVSYHLVIMLTFQNITFDSREKIELHYQPEK